MTTPVIIRTSDRIDYKVCRERWEFGSKIRMNYKPAVDGQALRFGTAIHAGLEAFYDPRTWVATEIPKLIPEGMALAAFVESYKKPVYPSVELGEEATREWEAEVELGKQMLKHYFEYSAERDSTFKPLMTEIEFEVPIPVAEWLTPREPAYCNCDDPNYHTLMYDGRPIVYQGRIDLLMEDSKGGVWIWDHKTTGKLGPTEHLILDEQCGSYAWALKQQLGIEVQGVVYNELLKDVPHKPTILKKGDLSQNKNQNTTYNIYLTTLKELGYDPTPYQEFLDFLKENPREYVRRTTIYRSQKELEILGDRIALEAAEMVDPNLAIYPNPSRWNCGYCAFKQPCIEKQSGGDWEWLLANTYVNRAEEAS